MLEQETVEIRSGDSEASEYLATFSPPAFTTKDAISNLKDVRSMTASVHENATLLQKLAEISDSTGGYVQLLPEMSYIPVLIGNDSHPVYLYQLVEMLEGYLDFDAILAEFPTLSFSHIVGSLSFLRKVAQINSRQLDIDELEDHLDAQNADFMNDLRKAFEEREEGARVLTDAL